MAFRSSWASGSLRPRFPYKLADGFCFLPLGTDFEFSGFSAFSSGKRWKGKELSCWSLPKWRFWNRLILPKKRFEGLCWAWSGKRGIDSLEKSVCDERNLILKEGKGEINISSFAGIWLSTIETYFLIGLGFAKLFFWRSQILRLNTVK